MLKLKDEVIILTGATSGIGKCLALSLAKEGAKMAVCGRSEEKMLVLLEELEGLKQNEVYHQVFCLSSENRIVNFVQKSYKILGTPTILINCAGLNAARGGIEEISISDLEWMTKINLSAPVILMREAFNLMKLRGKGHMVNILSTVCLFANEGIGGYTASKTALDAITKVFRKEARHHRIKVTSIYPGGVNTDFRIAQRPEYLTAQSVANSILSILLMDEEVAPHELVLRPMVEENFA